MPPTLSHTRSITRGPDQRGPLLGDQTTWTTYRDPVRSRRASAASALQLRRRQLAAPGLRAAGVMGLLELLIIILVLVAIFGGIAVSPLLFVLLIVVLVILFTRGGFDYRRGGRL